jgi:hypothetical protein
MTYCARVRWRAQEWAEKLAGANEANKHWQALLGLHLAVLGVLGWLLGQCGNAAMLHSEAALQATEQTSAAVAGCRTASKHAAEGASVAQHQIDAWQAPSGLA